MLTKALSIGVIGGADGPTAIFVTSTGWEKVAVGVVLAGAAIAGIRWLAKRKK